MGKGKMGKGISIALGKGSGLGVTNTTASKGQMRMAFLGALPFIVAILFIVIKVIFFSPSVDLFEFLIVFLIAGIVWYPFIIFMWLKQVPKIQNDEKADE